MLRDLLQRAGRSVAALLYPPRCPICAAFVAGRDLPCDACDARLVRLPGDARIALPVRVWLSRARSCFAYDDPLRAALHDFKYSGRFEGARFFARCLAEEAAALAPLDAVVPVPMHAGHLWARGHNAAALLAGALSRLLRIRCERGALRKVRRTLPQVGLAREERLENLRGAFEVLARRRRCIEGARVLLIDDILTTGSTANECARALVEAGAQDVAALTLARAV